jgi:translation initiation factor 2D
VIKHSSFKKLKPFMKSVEKEGILKLKELSGELSITAVDLSHAKIAEQPRYRTVGDDQKKISKAKAAEEAANAAPKTMTITELYKSHGSSSALFKAVGARYLLTACPGYRKTLLSL